LLRFSLVFIIFFGAAAAVVLILIDFFLNNLLKLAANSLFYAVREGVAVRRKFIAAKTTIMN